MTDLGKRRPFGFKPTPPSQGSGTGFEAQECQLQGLQGGNLQAIQTMPAARSAAVPVEGMGIYTASAIAAALGRKRQNVSRALSRVSPDGVLLVNGQKARGWAVNSLPRVLKEALTAATKKRGFATHEQLLLRSRPDGRRAEIRAAQCGNGGLWTRALSLADSHFIKDRPWAQALFWDAVCAAYRDAIESGGAKKALRRELRQVIEAKVHFIDSGGRALDRMIGRRLDRWSKGGASAAAVLDLRGTNSGRRAAQTAQDGGRILRDTSNGAGERIARTRLGTDSAAETTAASVLCRSCGNVLWVNPGDLEMLRRCSYCETPSGAELRADRRGFHELTPRQGKL